MAGESRLSGVEAGRTIQIVQIIVLFIHIFPFKKFTKCDIIINWSLLAFKKAGHTKRREKPAPMKPDGGIT